DASGKETGHEDNSDFQAQGGEYKALAVQPDSKVIAVGDDGNGTIVVERMNNDDSFTTDFEKTLSNISGSANGVAVQADGTILIAGGLNGDFQLARLLANGDEDLAIQTDLGAGDDQATSIAIQPADGKIVLAGSSGNNFAIARYLSDAALDPD